MALDTSCKTHKYDLTDTKKKSKTSLSECRFHSPGIGKLDVQYSLCFPKRSVQVTLISIEDISRCFGCGVFPNRNQT